MESKATSGVSYRYHLAGTLISLFIYCRYPGAGVGTGKCPFLGHGPKAHDLLNLEMFFVVVFGPILDDRLKEKLLKP